MIEEIEINSGEKVKFIDLSQNNGVIWIETKKGWKTHILISDLTEESKCAIYELIEKCKK